MTQHHPAEQPGHLDIDAVSAFIDRNFDPDELATIERHLASCPECLREVLEIRTTVLLLAALPQYVPRRSFCLGVEHARRRRRPPTAYPGNVGTGGGASPWQPVAASVAPTAPRYANWLPGLQTIAIGIGMMLLLVTMTDMLRLPANQMQFAAPLMLVPTATAAPAEMIEAEPMAADDEAPDQNVLPAAAPLDSTGANVADQGTTAVDGASQEMSKVAAPAPARVSGATSSVVVALTPPAGVSAAPTAIPVATDVVETAESESRPSPIRMVQIVLALLLGWLIVTIVGLRKVRALS
ncbi:MAG: zf-HC2 domain-containing protein [Thermomicrobiales bacterium]